MSLLSPPPGLEPADFERIESAVLETERGRWFLAEYGRRVRDQSLGGAMAALSRIEDALTWGQPASDLAVRRLAAQAEAIEERLQDLAWRLREQNADKASAAVEAEIFALRGLIAPPPTDPRPERSIQPSYHGSRFEPTGELSERLASIEQLSHSSDGAQSAELACPPAGENAALAAAGLPAPKSLEMPEDLRHEAFSEVDALSSGDKLAFFA
jgi:hypothetical protein